MGSVSRNYEHRGSELAAHTQSGFNLQASVVIPMYGETPAYLAETMRYYEMAGIKHVYFGIVGEKAKGETLKEQMQPFISRGFVSVLESDEWPDLRIHSHMNGAESLRWKTIINDWALYHAKSWDDLLLLHDYDELMVPTQGNTVPDVIQHLLRQEGVELQSLCFFQVCPTVTYGEEGRTVGQRLGLSRAEDFPFMEAGNDNPTYSVNGIGGFSTRPEDSASAWTPKGRAGFCAKGGYQNTYPKSIVVVATSYKTGVHNPGSCSAANHDPHNGEKLGPYMFVSRESLTVEHTTEMKYPGRMVPRATGSKKQPSAFARIWAPRLKHAAGTSDYATHDSSSGGTPSSNDVAASTAMQFAGVAAKKMQS